jgi:hypothetical protein
LTLSNVQGIDSFLTKLSECLETLQLLSNLLGLLLEFLCWSLDNVLGNVLLLSLGTLQFVSSGIVDLTLLEFTIFSWEKDQLALVTLKALNIDLQSFL